MKNLNKKIGFFGESIAKDYLIKKGYIILEENFICMKGEVDIITKKNNIISFVEVKTRNFDKFGKPLEAVDYFKKKKIINVALVYIQKYNLKDYFFKFDVLEVTISRDDVLINFIEDAFRL